MDINFCLFCVFRRERRSLDDVDQVEDFWKVHYSAGYVADGSFRPGVYMEGNGVGGDMSLHQVSDGYYSRLIDAEDHNEG